MAFGVRTAAATSSSSYWVGYADHSSIQPDRRHPKRSMRHTALTLIMAGNERANFNLLRISQLQSPAGGGSL
jgi:hypothetical protein